MEFRPRASFRSGMLEACIQATHLNEERMPPASARPRTRALQILVEIEEMGAYANLALQAMGDFPPRDAGLITELVNGTTRMRLALDRMLSAYVRKGLDDLTIPIRNNLRMGAYQLCYMDRIPPHAAIDEAVKLAHRYGHSGVAKLTNAVLRRLQREGQTVSIPPLETDPVQHLSLSESLPSWLIAFWIQAYGLEQAIMLAKGSNQPNPLTLRVNTLKTSRDSFLAEIQAAGLDAVASPILSESIRFPKSVALSKLPGFAEGLWYVQGEAAMLASKMLDPQPGETIADVGAAPGGKTTNLAALMKNQGEILAIDSHGGRLELVKENVQRLGIGIVKLLNQEGAAPYGKQVDRVLVDAPCSGLGVLYRKADLRWRITPEQLKALPAEQLGLLDHAANSLKPGGVLVYATCTINPEENEEVVKRFLETHPDFQPGNLEPFLPEGWRAEAKNGMIQLVPGRHGVEGFFLARMERKNG